MARKKKVIVMPRGAIKRMMKELGQGQTNIYNSLAYRSDSERAKMIRKAAIEFYGGIETTKIVF